MTKRKTIIGILLCAVLAVCAAGLAACGKKKSKEQQPPPPATEGTFTLLDFEDKNDLYAVKPLLVPNKLNPYGKIRVVTDEQYSGSAGKGSLKYTYNGGTDCGILFYPKRTAYAYLDTGTLLSFGMDLYNPAESEKYVTLALYSATERVYGEKQALQPGWNTVTLTVDPVLAKYRSDELVSFAVQFEGLGRAGNGSDPKDWTYLAGTTPPSYDFYFDNWTAKYGQAELTEAQQDAVAFAEKVQSVTNLSLSSGETLLQAYALYANMTPECRVAVQAYYEQFQSSADDYIELLRNKEVMEGKDDSVAAFTYFSQKDGLLQLRENPDAKLGYDAVQTVGDSAGSVAVELGGASSEYAFAFYLPTVVLGKYDYVEFTVYNASSAAALFYVNTYNTSAVTLSPEATTTVQFPVAHLLRSGGATNTFTVGFADGAKKKGTLYFTSFMAHSLSDELFTPVLKSDSFTAVENATVTKSGDVYNVQNGAGTPKIAPQKEVKTVNVAQSVTFAVNAKQGSELVLYNAANAELRRIAFDKGVSTVVLSSAEYASLAHMRLGKANESFALTPFYASRTADIDYLDVLLRIDGVTKAADLTAENCKEALYYLALFGNMSGGKRVQIKAHNAGAYPEKGVYAEIKAKADTISRIMADAITAVQNGTATAAQNELVIHLSDMYVGLPQVDGEFIVTQPNAAQLAVIAAAKEGALDREYTLFDFANPMNIDKIVADLTVYDWVGNVNLEKYDDRSVLAVNVQKPATGSKYLYVHYDNASVVNTLKNYDYVVVRVYAPRKVNLYHITYKWESRKATYPLNKGWNELTIPVSDFLSAGYMVIDGMEQNDKVYFANFTACAYQYVDGLLASLPEPEDVTDGDIAQIAAIQKARKAYDTLTVLSQKKLMNAHRLLACEAEPVRRLIAALPSPEDLADGNATQKAAVNAARKAYDALDISAQNAVINVERMFACEVEYVQRLVNGLPDEGNITVDSIDDDALIEARSLYNALSASLKNRVKNAHKILTCEVVYLQSLIDALPAADELNPTMGTYKLLIQTRKMYNALDASVRIQVKNTEKLGACEQAVKQCDSLVYDMTEKYTLGLFERPEAPYPWEGDFSLAEYEGHAALKVHVTKPCATGTYVYMHNDLSGMDVSGYDTVTFKVRGSVASIKSLRIITKNWGERLPSDRITVNGKALDKSAGFVPLSADEWTTVTVSVADFKKFDHFIFECGTNGSVDIYIADMSLKKGTGE